MTSGSGVENPEAGDSLSAALAAEDVEAVQRALLAGSVLMPLQHRRDGSVIPRLVSSGDGDGVALPGFSSESVLRAALGGITDWVTIRGLQWAALARRNDLQGVIDPGTGSYVLDQLTIDQLADGLVPATGDQPAQVAAEVKRYVRPPQTAAATSIQQALVAGGVEAAVVDLARGGPYRLTVVVLAQEPQLAVDVVRSLALPQSVDVVEADDGLRDWIARHVE